jgi:uncharacterized membrane protein (UPF0127 family)
VPFFSCASFVRISRWRARASVHYKPGVAARLHRGRLDAARTVMVGAAVVLALSGALAAAACTRTPAEPKPSAAASSSPGATGVGGASSGAVISTASGSAAAGSGAPFEGRCVRPTPAQPPPPAAPAAPERCPRDPGGAPRLAVATLAFPEAARGTAIEAEIARAPSETERGLMYRTHMPEEHGMLFALGERREHVFWMRNTCLPLDMLFVDDDGLIVGILENVPTLNDQERTVGCASTKVIETNAGWSRRHGVRAGQHVKIPAEL